MTGSSVAGILGAAGGLLTAASIFLGVLPALVKMRREVREDRREEAEEAARVAAKLEVIHTLTNATLSAAYEATLAATKRELVMTREVGRLFVENGQEPSDIWRASIGELEGRVADLTLLIQERQTQTFAANLQIANEERRQVAAARHMAEEDPE